METFVVVFVILTVFSLTLASHWVDNKYNLQLVKWLNCEVSSPFKERVGERSHAHQHTSSPSNAETEQLRERIENLEKIVTDSSWELNQKIKNL